MTSLEKLFKISQQSSMKNKKIKDLNQGCKKIQVK